MKKFKWLAIIFLALMIGCASAPAPEKPTGHDPNYDYTTEYISASFSFDVRIIKMKYDITNQKETDDIRCYIFVKITDIPEGNNAWRNAGFQVGDYISMFETPGGVSPLQCNNSKEDIRKWFPGKVREQVYSSNGYVVERFRLAGPKF